MYPHLVKGTVKALCIVRRLKVMMKARAIRTSAQCTKQARPTARCQHCPPLFASFKAKNGKLLPMSRQQVSGVVKQAVGLLRKDVNSFSGISMRRGGISQAVHARCQNRSSSCRAATARRQRLGPTWYSRTRGCCTRRRERCVYEQKTD
jgi:hypothetical protein